MPNDDTGDANVNAVKTVQESISPVPPTPVTACPAGAKGSFATQDEAARAALGIANPQSIKANREYGGLIYKDKDGKYYYTGPIQGSDQGVNPKKAPVPAGTQVVGDYH